MVVNNQTIEMSAEDEFKLVDMVASQMNWPWAMAMDQIQVGNLKIDALVNTWLKNWRAGAFKPMQANFDPELFHPHINPKNLYNETI
jgi:hypothetical protein